MADKVEFDEHLFRGAAAKTGHVNDRVTSIMDTLKASVESHHGCWGHDTIGTTFANGQDGSGGYTKSSKLLTDNGDAVAEGFANMSQSQTESAEFLHNMELDNRYGLR
ncbi:hypothetical protein [Nocardia rosealba]|uniref:hypothetical protein n=1 Tax=Nocardia TaxID=1817 RepID=UPI001CD9D695|nr:hypothetical protein [Nocardia rosealba]MCA2210175.1 hypothetical protein [Nocardia rosealba]